MRISVVIGSMALTLAAAGLTACGSDSSIGSSASGSYCDELKADKGDFASLSGSNADLGNLDQVFKKLHTLADDAPDNVADDWKTLDGAVTTIETALKDAGVTSSDLAALQNGQVPKDVDPAKLQALLPKLQALSSADVTDAANNIAADAKKTCGVDLGSK
ncbi:MAG TPA: hypothetical protein VMT27_04620 [Actinomycetes bacterium]|nr:hypothetical protein [Actinomycetes bacterium]